MTKQENTAKQIEELLYVFKELGLNERLLSAIAKDIPQHFSQLDFWVNLCSSLRNAGQYHAAYEAYEKAMHLFPNDARLYNNRSILLTEWERYAEAMEDVDKAIALKPDYANAITSKARIFERMHQFEEAIAFYEKALELSPDNAAALNSLGTCYLVRGRIEKAEERFLTALSIDPGNGDALFNLGGLYLEKGKPNIAEQYLGKLLTLFPGDEGGRELLAKISSGRIEANFKLFPAPKHEPRLYLRPSLNIDYKGKVVAPNKNLNSVLSSDEIGKMKREDAVAAFGFKTVEIRDLAQKLEENIEGVTSRMLVKHDFFVSYRWHNALTEQFVDGFAHDLVSRGYTVVYDKVEISKTPDINATDLISRMAECEYVICVLTKEYRALVERSGAFIAVPLGEDGWVLDEWETSKQLANRGLIKRIGLWLSDVVVPFPFTKSTCMDFREATQYRLNLDKHFPERKFTVMGFRGNNTVRTIGPVPKTQVEATVEELRSTREFSQIAICHSR